MFNLSELQHDALVEIFNIGVGHAARAMSDIVNEEVTMSVPHITFLNRADA
ncbi:chemotaxis protein CheC [Massilia sp. B-10]|nr:chemotaxis protein CheC [Massilia sp. B-10]UUZ53057.1 chemotaxis protein CheC [Massilia sp. H-1]